jgi:hypothetical protein
LASLKSGLEQVEIALLIGADTAWTGASPADAICTVMPMTAQRARRGRWGKKMTTKPMDELDAMRTALDALSPLEADAQSRALAWITSTLGIKPTTPNGAAAGTSGSTPIVGGTVGTLNGELGDAKQFLALKAPKSDIERVACLAYYLTHAGGKPQFDTKDITEMNLAAAAPRLSNTSYSVSNAQKKNAFLAPAAGGKKQITHRGEAFVEALPDRDAVKAVLKAIPGPRRSTGGKRRKSVQEEG